MVVVVAVPMWDVEGEKINDLNGGGRGKVRREREMGSSNFPSTKFFFLRWDMRRARGKSYSEEKERKKFGSLSEP